MAAALEYKNYDYRYEYGEGGHNLHHMGSLAGDAMRWVWSDVNINKNQ
jgi:enterochelin esterase family protein